MGFKPVIDQKEPIKIALCPKCAGYGFYSVERFLTDEDHQDIENFRLAGYTLITRALHLSLHIDECSCSLNDLGMSVDLPAKPAPSTRPRLSLKRK